MPTPVRRPRLVVLSPFLDKRHGTERCVAEQIERLAGVYEIHLYSSRVEDVDLSGITWHRVPALGGPHLFAYIWWLCANRLHRWRDAKFRGIAPDVIYSARCELSRRGCCQRPCFVQQSERANRSRTKSRYRVAADSPPANLLSADSISENKVYGRDDIFLAAVSEKGAQDIRARFGPKKHLSVIYHGVDCEKFNSKRRLELRANARAELKLPDDSFAVLFIGNDWRNRGLPCLLKAVGMLQGRKHMFWSWAQIHPPHIRNNAEISALRAAFLSCRRVATWNFITQQRMPMPVRLSRTLSRFRLPKQWPAVFPVITSRATGVSEIIHHNEDGSYSKNPTDAKTLSEWLARLANDAKLAKSIGLSRSQDRRPVHLAAK